MDQNERLRSARKKAGFETAADAARRFGWTESTYNSHENGNRGFPAKRAPIYAKAFGVREEWLLFGRGEAAAGDDSASRAADAEKLTAIYRALPTADDRAEMMRFAETLSLASEARSKKPKGVQDPDGSSSR